MIRTLLRQFIKWEIRLVIVPCAIWWFLLGGLYLMPRNVLAAPFLFGLFLYNAAYIYVPNLIAPSHFVMTDLGKMPSGLIGWLLAIGIYSIVPLALTLTTVVTKCVIHRKDAEHASGA